LSWKHTHTSVLWPSGLCPGLPGWAGTRTNLDFTEARDSEWQWHQLGHMQICTSLQTDNHANIAHLSFYRLDASLPPNQQSQSTEGKSKPLNVSSSSMLTRSHPEMTYQKFLLCISSQSQDICSHLRAVTDADDADNAGRHSTTARATYRQSASSTLPKRHQWLQKNALFERYQNRFRGLRAWEGWPSEICVFPLY